MPEGVRLTARERAEGAIARALAMLPPALQVRLSGRPPVSLDGNTLAPSLQLALSLLERRPPPALGTQTPAEMRSERRRLAAVYSGRPPRIGAVADLPLDGTIRARHYSPAEPGGPHPLLVYLHGGGFTFGDLDTHDGFCRLLCHHSGAHVLAIDYRLAPEHLFPGAVEDARAALAWAFAHAGELGADADRIGIGGDSAGGNLAAVVSRLATHDGGPAPVLQLLVYPVTDLTQRRRSRELFGTGFLLTDEDMDWFERTYLGALGGETTRDPRVSALRADDLSGLPSALVVTAGFDPLRDEGEAYAEALRAAGTPTVLRRFPDLIHAFINLTAVSRESRDAVIEIAAMTRLLFARPLPQQPGEGSLVASAQAG